MMRKDFNNHEEAIKYYSAAEFKIIDDIRKLQKRLDEVRITKAYNQRMLEQKKLERKDNQPGVI